LSLAIILIAALCLAYANGANDNFKGVATLLGSGTTSYRKALWWATATTLLGSLAAFFFAQSLLKSFSGRGLVDDQLVASADYGAAVAMGAGLTVLFATRIGMPISTTHGLIGALIGAGWAAGSAIDLGKLGSGFFLPLLVSPLLAATATAICYSLFRQVRRRFAIAEETCLCAGREIVEIAPAIGDVAMAERIEHLSVTLGTDVTCQRRYHGRVLGLQAGFLLDHMHYLSAGIVSFARGLNDTPKIAAVLLLVPALGIYANIALVGFAIAAGGLIGARRVAETMSNKITTMNHGQGFTSNLMTGVIVIAASRFGMPVSTTHVSCGSIFGIGSVTRQGNPRVIATILAAWATTLPLGATLGAASYWIVHGL